MRDRGIVRHGRPQSLWVRIAGRARTQGGLFVHLGLKKFVLRIELLKVRRLFKILSSRAFCASFLIFAVRSSSASWQIAHTHTHTHTHTKPCQLQGGTRMSW